jgi:hypothetical protein
MANLSTQERPRGIHDLPLFCSLLAVAMLVSAHVLYSDHTTKTTFDMTFCFGPAIRGLIEQHRLGYPDGVFGWWTYARRMPMIPVFGALVSSISTRFAVFFAIKNLLCWSVWIYALLSATPPPPHWRLLDLACRRACHPGAIQWQHC